MPELKAPDRAPPPEDRAWDALRDELDLWAGAGRPATLWWRDDDAALVTPALEQLLGLGTACQVPLALAVVPGLLTPALAARLSACPDISVLQHGWRHLNHAPQGAGQGAWELGDHRPPETVGHDLRSGHRRLAEAVGERFLPVLVPPWNRIAAGVVAILPGLGFTGLSTFRARTSARPVPGLVQVNSHCDPIKWKQGHRFAGTAPALDDLVGHLRERRTGEADPDEATGLVTHHLAMDAPSWQFVTELLRRTTGHPAAVWQSAREVFRP